MIFAALCSIGVFGNVSVANMLHDQYAGLIYIVPALLGALLSVVWNYAATRAFVWGRGQTFGASRWRRAADAKQDFRRETAAAK